MSVLSLRAVFRILTSVPFGVTFLRQQRSQDQPIQHLDIATGNGAILAIASAILDANTTTMTCVDISAAAIENVEQRFPGVTGIVADATVYTAGKWAVQPRYQSVRH